MTGSARLELGHGVGVRSRQDLVERVAIPHGAHGVTVVLHPVRRLIWGLPSRGGIVIEALAYLAYVGHAASRYPALLSQTIGGMSMSPILSPDWSGNSGNE